MAESTAAYTLTDARADLGYFLGFGRTYSSMEADQKSVIDECIKDGAKMYYWPNNGYQWNFLKPMSTLVLAADDGDYDLPDDFGGMIGMGYFAQDEGYIPILIVDPQDIINERQYNTATGRPEKAGIRPKAFTGTSSATRYEILFYRVPNQVYNITYQYKIIPDVPTASVPYFHGTAQMGALAKAACMAAAERIELHEIGMWHDVYTNELASAMAVDLALPSRHYLGYNGDGSTSGHSRHVQNSVTYNGTLYDGS